jgi:xanthine dehydrogenase molybdenum-binding subunit
VLVNQPKVQPYRAPGAGNAALGVESVIDELAQRCGIDPIDFRLKNAIKEGSPKCRSCFLPRLWPTPSRTQSACG